MVLVTHDLDEAITLSDRIVVVGGRPGRIVADQMVDPAIIDRRDTHATAPLRGALLSLLGEELIDSRDPFTQPIIHAA